NHGGTDTGLTAAVNNAGTWTKNGGSLTSTISTLFNNTGTVDVETGTLNLTGAVTNTGLLKADGGNLFVAGTIGGGSGEISGSSILEFSGPSNANITFDSGSTGTLKVDGSQGYGGTISGLALGNYVDLTNVQYFGSLYQPQYVANADNTGGTLWVVTSVTSTSGGVAVGYSALLNISGTYSANSFVQSSDGHGGSLITDPPSTSNSLSPAVSNDPTGTWMSEATDAAGPSQSFIVQQGERLEFLGASSADISFATGSMESIQLCDSQQFSGTIAGFASDDAIDLSDIGFGAATTLAYSAASDGSPGALTVSDGSHAAQIALLGQYIAGSFAMSGDGHGGTLITETPSDHQPLASAHA
ncbi:MAG TPA: hypothetical protein VKW08_22050, partial [Xanthobacteraceae bacterium]|nr:hypothetical protein [Xanthobacteraceae bacterium]